MTCGQSPWARWPLPSCRSPAHRARPPLPSRKYRVPRRSWPPRRGGSVRLIARLARPADGAPLTPALATRRAADLATAMRAAAVARVDSIRGLPLAVLEARPAQLATLLRSGLVEAVQEDVAVPPGLAQNVALVDAPRAWAAGASGTGWAVAILDTGVDATHPFLAGRVAAEACFSSTTSVSTSVCPNGQGEQVGAGAGANCPATVAGCEHGTYVAGIAAGRDYTGGPGLNGVAPEAGIVPVQVFSRFEGQSCTNFHLTSPCALTWTSDQIKGLQQVAAFAATTRIAAVNMSLASGLYLSSCDSDLRKPAIDALAALGIPTVVAAGNDSSHIGAGAPACISSAVAVGASTTTTPEAPAPFTDDGPMVALLAPGVSITSSVPGNGWATADGTSAAAPHVAGAIADLRSKLPEVPAAQIVQALEATGEPITDTVSSITKPRIDVYDALASLSGAPTWQPWASRGGTLGSFPDCSLTGRRASTASPAAPSARCSGATATTATAGRPGPTSPARSAARRPAWSAARASTASPPRPRTTWPRSATTARPGALGPTAAARSRTDLPASRAQARRSTASPGAPTKRCTGSPSTARSGRPGRRSAGHWRLGRSASRSPAEPTASPSTPRGTCSSGGSPRASGAAGPSLRPELPWCRPAAPPTPRSSASPRAPRTACSRARPTARAGRRGPTSAGAASPHRPTAPARAPAPTATG